MLKDRHNHHRTEHPTQRGPLILLENNYRYQIVATPRQPLSLPERLNFDNPVVMDDQPIMIMMILWKMLTFEPDVEF